MRFGVSQAVRFEAGPAPESAGLSPVEALSRALHDTLHLLFRPFQRRRWIRLTAVCLFLGGGTTTAAFQWSLSALPGDLHLREALLQAVYFIISTSWLTALTIALGAGVALAWLYLRSVFRFVLVDSILQGDAPLGPSWTRQRCLGRSYFFWLVGVLAVPGIIFSGAAIAVYPYFQTSTSRGTHPLIPSLLLVTLLASIVLVGLAVGLLVVLTDDLVVPLMYAGRMSLARAWRQVAGKMRAEPANFAAYLLLRLTVAIGVSVAVLLFLFPVLLSFFSGAIIAAALVVLVLRALGMAWAWDPSTISLTVTGLLLLSSLTLVLLSVVGMPGQVFLQNFGIHFMASRFPPLQALGRLRKAPLTPRGQAGHRI